MEQVSFFFTRTNKRDAHLFNPDLWWFDGDWEHSAEQWESEKIRQLIIANNPKAIINGRLQGYGDYETPEQNIPASKPKYNWWELCMTINDNWGFHNDTNFKTPFEIISIFKDVIANGGNLLLDIGTKADGTIPDEEINILKELGNWNKRNGEAVFNTSAGIAAGHFYGPTTLSKDSSLLYLFLQNNPSGEVIIKGLNNKIKTITALGSQQKLTHKIVGKISWSHVPGIVYIPVPTTALDKYITVLKIELDKPISLYRGNGGFE